MNFKDLAEKFEFWAKKLDEKAEKIDDWAQKQNFDEKIEKFGDWVEEQGEKFENWMEEQEVVGEMEEYEGWFEGQGLDEKVEIFIKNFWEDIAKQDKNKLREYFHSDATVYWHATNEKFNVEDFLIANCEYPGVFHSKVEKIELCNSGSVVSVTDVTMLDKGLSFHAVSFFEINDGKIVSLNEYWADDTEPPKWRVEKQIGTKIR